MSHGRLFVYGTLLPGEVRWSILAPFVSGEGEPDAVAGSLFDTGVGYPAYRSGESAVVRGRRFELAAERRDEALAVLDEVEGAVRGLYRRVTVTAASGLEVFVYEYGGGLELTPIPDGDWLNWTRR